MSDNHKYVVDFTLSSDIFTDHRSFNEALNCRIYAKREEFISVYGSSPKYVILPLHWSALLEKKSRFCYRR